jgi:membrane protein DedA with SNARE-associated domain/rhodanese-related sulfurtransferase
VGNVQDLFDRFGVMIVFANTLLHELAVPIPLTPTVLVAGAMSSEAFAFAALVAAVVVGTVLGNALWFAAGRRYGAKILDLLCRFSLTPDTCVTRTSANFGRWGGTLFIIGRFLPGVSLVAPPVAGALGMRWSKFLLLTALGAAAWTVVVILIAAAFQQAVLALLKTLAAIPAGMWIAAATLLLTYIAWRFIQRRRAALALDVSRVQAAELHSALQSARPPVVIDVRGETMRQILAQRIPGAIVLGLDELQRYPLDKLGERDAVLYCSCPNEASAAAGVRILQKRGHRKPQALRGGLNGWIQAGYKVEIFSQLPTAKENT